MELQAAAVAAVVFNDSESIEYSVVLSSSPLLHGTEVEVVVVAVVDDEASRLGLAQTEALELLVVVVDVMLRIRMADRSSAILQTDSLTDAAAIRVTW